MTRRTLFLTLAPLALLIAWLLWLRASPPRGPTFQRSAQVNAGDRGVDLVAERSAPAREAVETSVAPTPLPSPGDCPASVIAAFEQYVRELRQLPAGDARSRQLALPSTSLRTETRERLLALGIVTLDGLPMGNVFEGQIGLVSQYTVPSALFPRWVSCALVLGEDLRGASLRYFVEETSTGVLQTDPPMLEFGCLALEHFAADADVALIAPRLLDALRAIPPDAEFEFERVTSLLRVLARYSWSTPWLREELLGLIELPWLSGIRSTQLIMLATAVGRYSDWREPLAHLLHHRSSAVRWGALEGLRAFAAQFASDPASGIGPDELFEAVPDSAFGDADTTLRWAAVELLANFGGDRGRDKLLALVADEAYFDRGSVLGFLAGAGKVGREHCVAFLASADARLRESAIDALATLARNDPESYAALRSAAFDNSDASLRQLAVANLGRSGRPEVIADLERAARDIDMNVQLEAIKAIGTLPEGQPQTLSTYASDHGLPGPVRDAAFDEWMLDAPDDQLASISRLMASDNEPEIRERGFIFMGAIALIGGDESTVREWESLTPPASLLAKAGVLSEDVAGSLVGQSAASLLDGSIRERMRAEVMARVEQYRDPLVRQQLAAENSFVQMGAPGQRLQLSDSMRMMNRIMQFLGNPPP